MRVAPMRVRVDVLWRVSHNPGSAISTAVDSGIKQGSAESFLDAGTRITGAVVSR